MPNEFIVKNGLISQGNITISGSITATGGVTVSGSIASASYASNAELLDGLDSTVFTLTSSFNAQTASFTAFTSSMNSFSASILTNVTALNAKTASFATTGSNTFVGAEVISGSLAISGSGTPFTLNTDTLEITGSLLVTGSTTLTGSLLQLGNFTTTGTIIAQTINVQTVTSSIVYSSGSNVFGNSLGNSQVFTGSVLITGSLTIAGASSATSYSGTTIYGSTAVCSAVGKFSTCLDLGGALTGTSATFSSCVTATKGTFVGTGYVLDLNRTDNTALVQLQYNGTIGSLLGTTGANNFIVYNASASPMLTLSGGAATFSSTITGTTIYGSTAVCSPVGKFTSCIDAGSGIFSSCVGTTALNMNNMASLGSISGGSIYLPYTAGLFFRSADGSTAKGKITADTSCNLFLNSDITGDVGIGTSTINYSTANRRVFEINGTSTTLLALKIGDVAKSYLYQTTTDLYIVNLAVAGGIMQFENNGAARLTIASTGIACFACQICVKEAVYINGSFPGVKLDRAGTSAQSDINWKDAGTSVWSIGTAVRAVGSSLDFYSYCTGDNVFKLTQTGITCFSGRVCTPSLTVSGDTSISGTSGTISYFPANPKGTALCTVLLGSMTTADLGYGPQFRFSGTTSGEFIDIGQDKTGGFVVETTDTPRFTITQGGNIGAPSGTNIYNASDIRLKQNITTITCGLCKINALNPVKFNWIHDFEPTENDKDLLGFIAQEVQTVIPEAVENFGKTSIIVGETTIETPLRVNEKFIIPVLVKAIQEQQCTICSQASMINTLKTCLGIN